MKCCKHIMLKDIKKFMSFFPLSSHIQLVITLAALYSATTMVIPNGNFSERKAVRLIHDLNLDAVMLSPYYCLKLATHSVSGLISTLPSYLIRY